MVPWGGRNVVMSALRWLWTPKPFHPLSFMTLLADEPCALPTLRDLRWCSWLGTSPLISKSTGFSSRGFVLDCGLTDKQHQPNAQLGGRRGKEFNRRSSGSSSRRGYVDEFAVLKDSFRMENLGCQVGPLPCGLHLGLAPFLADPPLPPGGLDEGETFGLGAKDWGGTRPRDLQHLPDSSCLPGSSWCR